MFLFDTLFPLICPVCKYWRGEIFKFTRPFINGMYIFVVCSVSAPLNLTVSYILLFVMAYWKNFPIWRQKLYDNNSVSHFFPEALEQETCSYLLV